MWIKVCGMTTDEAIEAALQAKVDAIGFVFAESKRQVTPLRAQELAMPARGRIRIVAVTRHPRQSAVDEILSVFRPDILQTDAEDFDELRLPAALERLPVIRAGRAEPNPLPMRVLFEGPISGTGVPADWSAASQLSLRLELVLAGGLTPENVGAAITQVNPFGVDVSTGVEQSPGLKSPEKIASFVRSARAAARSLERPERAKENAS
jgi:phosphoribosylanthranilate isomerase